ncbi:macrolide ABC transporter ATP-binding protein/permease MacB [Serratia sp. UGAL515B_01]|uniref:macrolide ABC transporter ATP-binding protein/permease MacB n=1 Tax=Serratia sp. UGAL515B_01 TaxID=2986763 RepID=UPI002953291A|nr:macrolide ABC transporter ATP-binding protein/permease MacB [Serratia sp. UGAL515B_01]WON78179.1 macrolide ABC transporter ATP-binding protein/permease MacB [Serratia sp. UGAL515B_01]
MAALLELSGIGRCYLSGEQTVDVLKNVSLRIDAGEMVAIMGASGSGKSTLMNILGCLDKPSTGIYRVAGQDVAALDSNALAQLRREHFGFIFQRYHLLPHLSAAHNVEVPAVYAGLSKVARRERAVALLQRLGLGERTAYRPNQLSGGQQQRVSIARALMNGGQVILADEPTGALDSHSGGEVMNILKQLREQGHTVIIVTHDAAVARQAERIIEIRDGEIVADSRPPIQTNPQSKKLILTVPSPSWRQVSGRFRESLIMAWRAMAANKMRTALTMLGIVIGIASVVSILVIGDAAKQMVLADIKSIGTNTVDVFPGKDFGDDDPTLRQSLKYGDLSALSEQPYVNALSPNIGSSMRLRFGSIDVAANVSGVNAEYFRVYGMTFSQGRGIDTRQVQSQAQIAVIDANTQRRLFPHQRDVVGKVILVGNMPATVVGVAQIKPSMFGSSNTLNVWVPYTTMANRLVGHDYFDSITVRIRDGYSSQEAEQQLTRLLTLLHGKKDFFTYNMDSLVQTAEKTTRTLQLFLTLVAVISLVVGGIGVMNIMLVSVTERTREIGIRMAVGARSSDVLQQFLIEAILVCLVGGAVGITLSFVIGLLAELVLPGWQIKFPPAALLSAFLCSTGIGVVFGYLPARNAARLNPIDALARE